jgi:hypothetical protein
VTDRAVVFEGSQVGVEVTPGTSVAANKRLLSTTFTPGISSEMQNFGPRGSKFDTIVIGNKEWTTAGISSVGNFTDIMYLFAMMWGAPATTTPAGGTVSRQHVWTPVSFGPDNPKTLTIETGSSIRAEKFSNAFANSLSMAVSRGEITFGGEILGLATSDGITLTATPTDIEQIPIAADTISIYLDNTGATLGTTQLLRAISAGWELSGKAGLVWALNRAKTSFSGTYEKKPGATANLVVGADSAGMAFLTDWRNEQIKFLRIEAVGPIIETTIAYKLMVDIAVRIQSPDQKGDEDGLLTQPYGFTIVHDATWGKAMQVTLINKIASL